MPPVPIISPATGNQTAPYYIHTTRGQFVDTAGRTLLLRGVNLSGTAKAPVNRPSYVPDDVAQDGGESFVGRPLNLDDGSADVHLARLRGWGFNMLRYVITWESLEHAGPGKYDFEFMDYTIAVLRKCKEYGFKVYMDPHQDVWSRFSGGSGAPYWTLPACGIDPTAFAPTQAAIVHSEYPNQEYPEPASLPAMIWSTNYNRLLSQTVFTLFFAGKDFAPKCIIDGQNIQDWLQSHYITAFGLLADRLRQAGDLFDECVIGWDSLNEPFEGLCGNGDLNAMPTQTTTTFKKGPITTPAQSLRLGMGQPQTVETWDFGSTGPKKTGTVTIDPKGITIWSRPASEREDGVDEKWGWKRDPAWKLGTCVWALHGVWDVESGIVTCPDYFKTISGQQVIFIDQHWKPHWQAFSKRIRASHPESIMFIQPPVFALPPSIDAEDLQGRCAYSAHYYDGLTLVSRHWNWFNADALGVLRGKYKTIFQAVKIGERMIRKSIQDQLGVLKSDVEIIGDYPTIIGEIGTPFDMDGKRSYGWTDDGKYKGDYSNQQKALDASMNAADGPNALNYTLWTYCPDSSHMWGDGWNMEDLSIWSYDDLKRNDGLMKLNSSGSFLKRKHSRTRIFTRPVTAASSSISLPTLANYSGEEETKALSISSLEGWENPYEFLTDGARAVKAFSRPWPTAVVGVPKDIQFDIAKAEFKLTIVVQPEDIPDGQRSRRTIRLDSSASSVMSSASSVSIDFEDGTYAEFPTEIYVPLVHYAHQGLVAKSCGQVAPEEDMSMRGGRSQVFPPLSASSTTLVAVPSSSDDPCPLDIHVQVSEGKWELSGQVLKWWYPVPEEGECAKEYTICITRVGGAIKTLEEQERESRQGCLQRLWSDICRCFAM